jgi:hypothetical protein
VSKTEPYLGKFGCDFTGAEHDFFFEIIRQEDVLYQATIFSLRGRETSAFTEQQVILQFEK